MNLDSTPSQQLGTLQLLI